LKKIEDDIKLVVYNIYMDYNYS